MREHRKNPPKKKPRKRRVEFPPGPAKPVRNAVALPNLPPALSSAHLYGPELLLAHGPLMMGSWDVPKQQRNLMDPAASAAIKPISGALLVDTGAGPTSIAQHVAEALGLIPVRFAHGYGAGGLHQNPIYRVALDLRLGAPGQEQTITFEFEAQGIPEMDKYFGTGQVVNSAGPVTMIGLLGRDILQSCVIKYDGLRGIMELQFHPQHFMQRQHLAAARMAAKKAAQAPNPQTTGTASADDGTAKDPAT